MFFCVFLFTHIFPTLIISNAGLGTSVFLQIPVNQVFTGIFAFYGVLKVYLIVYILLKYSDTFQKNKIKNVGHLLANIK